MLETDVVYIIYSLISVIFEARHCNGSESTYITLMWYLFLRWLGIVCTAVLAVLLLHCIREKGYEVKFVHRASTCNTNDRNLWRVFFFFALADSVKFLVPRNAHHIWLASLHNILNHFVKEKR